MAVLSRMILVELDHTLSFLMAWYGWDWLFQRIDSIIVLKEDVWRTALIRIGIVLQVYQLLLVHVTPITNEKRCGMLTANDSLHWIRNGCWKQAPSSEDVQWVFGNLFQSLTPSDAPYEVWPISADYAIDIWRSVSTITAGEINGAHKWMRNSAPGIEWIMVGDFMH